MVRHFVAGTYQSGKTLLRRYLKAEISMRAAALSYHTLLSIVPILGLVFWYLASVRVLDRWLALTKNYILSQLNLASHSQFLVKFEELTSRVEGSQWGIVGLVLLAYTAFNLVERFGESVDIIMETGEHQPPTNLSPVALYLRRLFVMLALPVSVTVSLGVTQWLQSDEFVQSLFHITAVGAVLALPFVWLASIVVYFLVYHFIPRNLVPWRQALKAALIVAPLSEVVRFAFSYYNAYAVSTQKIWGVLAVIPMFILWVQIMWTLLLCGALFIRFREPGGEAAPLAPPPSV